MWPNLLKCFSSLANSPAAAAATPTHEALVQEERSRLSGTANGDNKVLYSRPFHR